MAIEAQVLQRSQGHYVRGPHTLLTATVSSLLVLSSSCPVKTTPAVVLTGNPGCWECECMTTCPLGQLVRDL